MHHNARLIGQMLYKIIDKILIKVFDKVKIKYYDTQRKVRKTIKEGSIMKHQTKQCGGC